ncbi:MAG: hypothetical protein Kow0069_33190 [Promethearchaeota archaeon]
MRSILLRIVPPTRPVPLFQSSEDGAFPVHYRVPALERTADGSLLAFVEAREEDGSDWAPSAIVARRCADPVGNFNRWDLPRKVYRSSLQVEPRTWVDVLLAARRAERRGLDPDSMEKVPTIPACTNNPAPVLDRDTGVVHLLFCEHYEHLRHVWSNDGGRTWSGPANLDGALEPLRATWPWTVVASGPGHGLQLHEGPLAGRLVVPLWLAASEDPRAHQPSRVATIYSDDGGDSWMAGELVPGNVNNPNETQLVQRGDGVVLAYSRTLQPRDPQRPVARRARSTSPDGSTGWTEYEFDPAVPEPVCQGSLLRAQAPLENGGLALTVLTLPDCLDDPRGSPRNRRNLTAWASADDARSWRAKRVIDPGPSAYSDLAADAEAGEFFCLYERGWRREGSALPVEVAATKFDAEWLLGGAAP